MKIQFGLKLRRSPFHERLHDYLESEAASWNRGGHADCNDCFKDSLPRDLLYHDVSLTVGLRGPWCLKEIFPREGGFNLHVWFAQNEAFQGLSKGKARRH